MKSYLTEKSIQIAGLQIHLLNYFRICFIKMLKNLIVVAVSDVALSEIKHIK